VGSREIDVVSISVSCVITSDGAVIRRPNVSSRRTERSLGSQGLSGVPSEVQRIDLRAALGFFTNMRIMALPYFSRRKLRAWRMRRWVAFLSPLKQACVACEVVVPLRVGSSRRRTLKESRSLGGGLRTVRRNSGVSTLDQSDGEGSSRVGSS